MEAGATAGLQLVLLLGTDYGRVIERPQLHSHSRLLFPGLHARQAFPASALQMLFRACCQKRPAPPLPSPLDPSEACRCR